MNEITIIEVRIYPEVQEVCGLGEKYTTKRYMAKFNDGEILQVEQSVWPKDTGYEGYGGYLWHWSEKEWIEEAKKRYLNRQQEKPEN